VQGEQAQRQPSLQGQLDSLAPALFSGFLRQSTSTQPFSLVISVNRGQRSGANHKAKARTQAHQLTRGLETYVFLSYSPSNTSTTCTSCSNIIGAHVPITCTRQGATHIIGAFAHLGISCELRKARFGVTVEDLRAGQVLKWRVEQRRDLVDAAS